MNGVARRIANGGRTPTDFGDIRHEVVIVGGGAAGIAVAASLRARDAGLDVAIIDPADIHYYQPGWTMVGAGVFEAQDTARTMGSLIPRGVSGSAPPSPPSSRRTTPWSSTAAGWSSTAA